MTACPDCGQRMEAHFTSDGLTFTGCPECAIASLGAAHDALPRVSLRRWGGGRADMGIPQGAVIAVMDEMRGDLSRILNLSHGGEHWLPRAVVCTDHVTAPLKTGERAHWQDDCELTLKRKVRVVQRMNAKGAKGASV
jgi:hypothetical protein